MMAQVSNMIPYKFVHTTGDAHLYLNHKDQVNEFLHRTHNNKEKVKTDYWNEIINGANPDDVLGTYYGPKLPTIKLNPEITNIFDFTINDIKLIDYNPLPAISAPVAV
jgi:thymidylate synthase